MARRGSRLVGTVTQKLDLYNPYLPSNRRRSLLLAGAFILSLAGTILLREMILVSLVVAGAAGVRALAWRRPTVIEKVQLQDSEMSYSGRILWLGTQLEVKLARVSVKAIQLAPPGPRLLVHDTTYQAHGILILACDPALSLHLGINLDSEQSQTLLDALRQRWPETAVELPDWDRSSLVGVMHDRSSLEAFAQQGLVSLRPAP